jgi:erythronate-4-phosphate dehydrogenase
VQERALLAALPDGSALRCVTDVWQHEPSVNGALARQVDLATPHIAGYSQAAKRAATEKLALAVQQQFGLGGVVDTAEQFEPMRLDCSSLSGAGKHWQVLLRACPLEQLSEEFKQGLQSPDAEAAFDAFRRRLAGRREFAEIQLQGGEFLAVEQAALAGLGFRFD